VEYVEVKMSSIIESITQPFQLTIFLFVSPSQLLEVTPSFLPVHRLEEKLSNLEAENQILRQQALSISPSSRALSARQRTTIVQVFFLLHVLAFTLDSSHLFLCVC